MPSGQPLGARIHPLLTLAWGVLACGVVACTPELGRDPSRIDEPRVLAVESVPAEVAPGGAVELRALYVDGDGVVEEGALAWAWCMARRPLAELGPIDRECLEVEGEALVSIGAGRVVEGTVPLDGCRLFGPEPPPGEEGQPSGRPVDPDSTGGYDQPIVLRGPDATPRSTLFGLRLSCGPGNATQRQAAELRRRYQANVAPVIDEVRAEVDGEDAGVVEADVPLVVAVGASVRWRARFAACPTEPACGDGLCTLDEDAEACAGDCAGRVPGCGGAETYLWFDPIELGLRTRREALAVAWYGTDGRFRDAQTGVGEHEEAREIEGEWTAPDEGGEVTVWLVARDDRGGASWAERRVRVE